MKKLMTAALLCSALVAPATPTIVFAQSDASAATLLLLEILADALSRGNSRMDHSILIESDFDVEYRIEVEGSLDEINAIGLERGDLIDGNVATGQVRREADAYGVDGSILRIVVSDPQRVTVIVDGARLSPEQLIDGSGEGAGGPVPNGPATFGGTWASNFGQLDLVQFIIGNDRFVIGDYAENGILVGRVYGSCASGVFTNANNAQANGYFRFRLNDAGAISGDWRWHADPTIGAWDASRSGDQPSSLDNFWSEQRFAVDAQRGVASQTGLWGGEIGQLHAYVGSNIWLSDVNGRGVLAALSADGETYFGLMTDGASNVAVSFSASGGDAQGSFLALPDGRQTAFDMRQTHNRSQVRGLPELGSAVLSCR